MPDSMFCLVKVAHHSRWLNVPGRWEIFASLRDPSRVMDDQTDAAATEQRDQPALRAGHWVERVKSSLGSEVVVVTSGAALPAVRILAPTRESLAARLSWGWVLGGEELGGPSGRFGTCQVSKGPQASRPVVTAVGMGEADVTGNP